MGNDDHAPQDKLDQLHDIMSLEEEAFLPTELRELPPLVLAYIGDAVFELWIRLRLVEGGYRRMQNLHKHAVDWVNAGSQAEILRVWGPVLSEEEADVVRRGRNTRGAVPRGAKVIDYRLSTGLEALVGYLYLAGRRERLRALLSMVDEIDTSMS